VTQLLNRYNAASRRNAARKEVKEMEDQKSCCVVVKASGAEECEPSCCGSFVRRFATSGERREKLESYREELKKELAGVEERLEELKKAK
jgi:flagellar motility protein MotE (MotC chaperone)